MNPRSSFSFRRFQLRFPAATLLGLLACLWPAASPVHAQSVAAAPTATTVLAPVYGANWSTETHPEMAAFNAWTRKTMAVREGTTAAAELSATDLVAGVRLAVRRRAILAGWMRADPARALAASVPAEVRAKLPAAVLRELETPFASVGEYRVYAALPALGGPAVQSTRREIKVDGRTYTAHVYGRRLGVTTKTGLFLHGILLGDEAVLDENVLRVLSAGEVASETRAARTLGTMATSGGTFAAGGPHLYRFASGQDLQQAEARLRTLEAHRTPETSHVSEQAALEDPASVPTLPDSAYTTGNKKVLVIRVDFSDLPGDPSDGGIIHTPSDILNVSNSQVAPYYARSSYNQTSLSFTVSSKLYRMPRAAATYAVNGDSSGLHTDAETAASADYQLSGFDRVCVVFSYLGAISGSQIGYAGLADLGGPDVWINGSYDFRTLAHELGHTYGLIHGNLWQVTDGNPVSPDGTSVEYGDIYETMGGNPIYDQKTDFNVLNKNWLGWISDSQVQTISTSGVYRVYRSDGPVGSGILGLRIARDETRNYWISVRRNFTENDSMTHGVYVFWSYNDGTSRENLLDLQTPGSDALDAALRTGTTFTDAAAGISITPVAEGGASPGEYEDVRINFFASVAPVITSSLHAPTLPGKPFSYQIVANNHPSSFGASGLPAGVSLNTTTGVISGTPATIDQATITISATNSLGTGTAVLTLTPVGANDQFAYPQIISGTSGQVPGNNANATLDPGETPIQSQASGKSIWYRWVAPASGSVRFDTTGSQLFVLLAAYTGSTVSSLTRIAVYYDDPDPADSTSHVTFTAQAGVAYMIAIDGFADSYCDTVLNWHLTVTANPSFFDGQTALTNGVYYMAFPNGYYFGYYSYLVDSHYLYHFDLGYEYVFDAADGKGGVYLYDFKSGGFFYTSPVFPFPYLYDFSLNTVLYYYPDPSNPGHYNTNGYRFFYRFDNGQIIVK